MRDLSRVIQLLTKYLVKYDLGSIINVISSDQSSSPTEGTENNDFTSRGRLVLHMSDGYIKLNTGQRNMGRECGK